MNMAGLSIPRWMWASLDDVPLAPAPEGVTPDFDHPQLVHYHSLTISCCCCFFFQFLFSAARLYAKMCILHKTTIDDYFYWVALPTTWMVLILNIYLDNSGLAGHHLWEIKLKSVTRPFLLANFLYTIILPVATWLVKATILFLILNAFKPVKWLRILCWAGIMANFMFCAVNVVVAILSCHPQGGFDRTSFLAGILAHSCTGAGGTLEKMSNITGYFGVVSDFYILLIPLPAVAQLRISKEKKLGVFLIFSSGFLTCIASIIALVRRVLFYGTRDLLVEGIPNTSIFMVELTVGLCITCVPSVAKIGRHIRNKRNQSRSGDISNGAENTGSKLPLRHYSFVYGLPSGPGLTTTSITTTNTTK